MSDKHEYLTPKEAAAILGVQAGTIRQYIARGLLTPDKRTEGSGKGTGHARFSRAKVEAFKSRHLGTSQPPARPARVVAPTPQPAGALVDLNMKVKLTDESGKERDAKLLAMMLE